MPKSLEETGDPKAQDKWPVHIPQMLLLFYSFVSKVVQAAQAALIYEECCGYGIGLLHNETHKEILR